MKKKHLEMLLERVRSHPSPTPALEQYFTPASIAADVLFRAHVRGDLGGKSVVDLGCGTGVFAIGAALLGAKRVVGVDVDPVAIETARENAFSLGVEVEWVVADVREVVGEFDTVFMNPPFGAQRRGADRPFFGTMARTGRTGYVITPVETLDFVEGFIGSLGFETETLARYDFPIPHMFSFHRSEKKIYPVVLLRCHKMD